MGALEMGHTGFNTNQIVYRDDTKFFDTAKNSTLYICYDEVGSDYRQPGQEDSILKELLRLKGTNQYQPNKSDVNEKAKTSLRPNIIVVSTNDYTLDAKKIVNFPNAIYRRFPEHLEVSTKIEFRVDGTDMLDVDKIAKYREDHNLSAEVHLDVNDYKIFKISITDNKYEMVRTLVCELKTDASLARWIRKSVRQHLTRCKSDVERALRLASNDLCPGCGVLTRLCDCISLEIESKTTKDEEENPASDEEKEEIRLNDDLPPHVLDALVAMGVEKDLISESFLERASLHGYELRIMISWFYVPVLITLAFSYATSRFYTFFFGLLGYFNHESFVRFPKLQGFTTDYKLEKLRSRIQSALANHKRNKVFLQTIGFAAALSLAYKMWNLYKTVVPIVESTVSQDGMVNMSRGTESESVWKKVKEAPIKAPAPHLSYSREYIDMKAKKHSGKLYTLSRDGSEVIGKTSVVQLKERIFLINAHAVHRIPGVGVKYRLVMYGNPNMPLDVNLAYEDFFLDEAEDLAVVFIPNCLAAKSIISHFPQMPHVGTFRGSKHSKEVTTPITLTTLKERIEIKLNAISEETIRINGYSYSHPPAQGTCGELISLDLPTGFCFAGIHAAGGTNNISIAAMVTQTMIAGLINGLTQKVPVSAIELDHENAYPIARNIPLHPKSPLNSEFHNMGQLYCETVGGTGGMRASPSSRVGRSILADYVEKHEDWLLTAEYCPPIMKKGWRTKADGSAVYLSPYGTDLKMRLAPKCSLDAAYLSSAIDSLKEQLDKVFTPEKMETMMPLSLHDSMNGVAGVKGIDSLDFSTSGGINYPGSKDKYFDHFFNEHNELVRKMRPDMLEKYFDIKKSARVGKVLAIPRVACLKDEPVSRAKADIGKTRVFAIADLTTNVLTRQLYLPLVKVLQSDFLNSGLAVGIDHATHSWTDLDKYLFPGEEYNNFAGDFKSYDLKMAPDVMLGAFDVLVHYATLSGNYTPEDITAMWAIAYDAVYYTLDYDGTWIVCFGSNPSGQPLTVIINSLVNLLYMRVMWSTCGYAMKTFNTSVRAMTYGDDNVLAVRSNYSEFNMFTVIKAFAAYGITYTTADKKEAVTPYNLRSEITFLKRGFVTDEILGITMAPIEEASLTRMLKFNVASRAITREQQSMQVLEAYVAEHLQRGRISYDRAVVKVMTMLKDLDLLPYLRADYLTYDALLLKKYGIALE
jgi:hypothetical protein